MNQRTDKLSMVDNERIENIEEITSPRELVSKYPLIPEIAEFIDISRDIISNIIHMRDDRLLVITWPCSIHDPAQALEFAGHLREMRDKNPHLFIVMRTYFEKPRTTIGWKWLIDDPYLDESHDINAWLEIARKLLLEINEMWIPTRVEFLDTLSPQYLADLVTWWAIWARTTESQEHRKLVSWLSMPVGFKNGTSGAIDVAVHAVRSANASHTFLSTTKEWRVAKVTTKWNPDAHVILRWWEDGPNYTHYHIRKTVELLNDIRSQTWVIIDASHRNSLKDPKNQPRVIRNIAEQHDEDEDRIAWVMIEANICEWAQKFTPWVDDPRSLKYGVSITDGCMDMHTNESMLNILNDARWAWADRKNS